MESVLIIEKARTAGAVAAGIAQAGPVSSGTRQIFGQWLADGGHASMAYMERWRDIRLDPRLLVAGARSVISMAFPYRQPEGSHHPHIADYALGRDYHHVLRGRLEPLVEFLALSCGATSRICVDSAPVLERYWAVEAGVGFIGRNHQLIVPGTGSGVFLAEIITTAALEPTPAPPQSCAGCGRCVEACPGRALDSGFDARRCRAYLTTEHRGALPAGTSLGGSVAGCDICQRVCPHNAAPPPPVADEFRPCAAVTALDRTALADMTASQWKRLVRGSALSRIPFSQMRRNLDAT